MRPDRLDEVQPFQFVGETKGDKYPRQRGRGALLSPERGSKAEASYAGEEREDIMFQIHPSPGAELGQYLLKTILIPHGCQLSEPLPQTLEVEQIDVGERKGLGRHSSKRRCDAIAFDLTKYGRGAIRGIPCHRVHHKATAGTRCFERYLP